jgi:hypothetical protein
MPVMSETALLTALGIVGAIAGSVIGFAVGEWMASERETKQLRREAAEQISTAWLESMGHLKAIDVQLSGGPPAPPIRPDFDHDAYAPMARLGIIGTPEVTKKAEAVGTLFQEAILVYFTSGSVAADRQAAMNKVMDGIRDFRDQAAKDIGR